MPSYLRGILLDLALLIWLHRASVFVSCKPRDSVAFVNQSTIFNCSTVLPKIVWYHYAVGLDETQGGEVVFRAGSVFIKYKTDFQVEEYEINGTYFCNLIIKSVKENFAGKYECRDKDGVGSSVQSAELIVIGSDRVCSPDSNPVSVIGVNDCGLEAEQVELSCSVNYFGKKPPVLNWTSDFSQKQDVLTVTHKISNNLVTYIVTLNPGNYVSGTKFTCYAIQSIGKEELCAFDIRLLYAKNTTIKIDIVVGTEVNCSVNTNSHSCLYELIKLDEKDSSKVSNSSVLKIENSGLHQCRATCDLTDKKCLIFGTTVNASESAIGKNPEEGGSGGRITVIVVLVILISILVVIGFLCIRRIRRGLCKKKPTNIQNEDTSKDLISSSGVEHPLISFQPDSAQAESAAEHPKSVENTGEGKILKRKRSEDGDEIFDQSVEPGITENSLNSTMAFGNHNKSLFENVTTKFPYTTLTAQVEDNFEKAIAGIAVFKEELFIVFEGSSKVEVFHAITFAFENFFIISNLNKPLDIASCPAEDCFFIYALGTDSSGEIFVIDRNGSLLRSWQTGESVGCLSVTLDSSVILSVWNSCLLKVYSSDGRHLKDVKLPTNIQPFHALRVTEDEFFISYGEKNKKIHGICLVNSNGEQIRNISEPHTLPGCLSFAFPKCLSLTSDGDCLIADSRNSRILLLTRMFEIVDILSAKDGLIRPMRIYFDYSNGRRLFVADNGNRNPGVDDGNRNPSVMIYEFTSND